MLVQADSAFSGTNALNLGTSGATATHFLALRARPTYGWICGSSRSGAFCRSGCLHEPSDCACGCESGWSFFCVRWLLANEWVIGTNGPVVTGQWVHVTLALDYGSHAWRLNIAGRLLLSNLGFKDSGVDEFTRSRWQGSAVGNAYLDDVTVSSMEPNDLDDDGDGMPNVWEKQYGLAPRIRQIQLRTMTEMGWRTCRSINLAHRLLIPIRMGMECPMGPK